MYIDFKLEKGEHYYKWSTYQVFFSYAKFLSLDVYELHTLMVNSGSNVAICNTSLLASVHPVSSSTCWLFCVRSSEFWPVIHYTVSPHIKTEWSCFLLAEPKTLFWILHYIAVLSILTKRLLGKLARLPASSGYASRVRDTSSSIGYVRICNAMHTSI